MTISTTTTTTAIIYKRALEINPSMFSTNRMQSLNQKIQFFTVLCVFDSNYIVHVPQGELGQLLRGCNAIGFQFGNDVLQSQPR